VKPLIEVATAEQRRILQAASAIASEAGLAAWVVGGPVRDALLGQPYGDLDFTLESGATEFASRLAAVLGGRIRQFDEFMTLRIELPSKEAIDVTTSRAEEYPKPGALPRVRPAGLVEDLRRRDFTVNALALDLISGSIEDPFEGIADLERGLLRVLHAGSFREDPTRMMRAARLAARLRFELEESTAALMQESLAAGAMDHVSRERRWRELRLAIEEADPAGALFELASRGTLDSLLGAVHPGAVLRERLQEAASVIAAEPHLDADLLLLAALVSKLPDLRGSSLSRRRIDALRTLVDRERFAAGIRSGAIGSRDLAAVPEELLAWLELDPALRESAHRERTARRIELPFRGHELGLPPGPHLGRAFRDTREAIASGKITRAEALSFARSRALEYLRDEAS
jgi:tRNA nucleotidyltransferase (CCA-adding enzyme)